MSWFRRSKLDSSPKAKSSKGLDRSGQGRRLLLEQLEVRATPTAALLYENMVGEIMEQAAQSYEYNIENGLAIVGSPETVVRKLEETQQRLGYDVFCTNHSIGRMPPALVSNSIELFGKEVIPAFAPVGSV